MPELFPLAALRDPVAFLAGARIPLVPRAGDGRWECVNGTIYRNIAGSLEAAEEYDEATDQTMPSRAALATLALDLADPDVARWCDRKIAEVMSGGPVNAAVLGIHRDRWSMATLGGCRPMPRLPAAHVLGIEVAIPNIWRVRRALLLRHLGHTP